MFVLGLAAYQMTQGLYSAVLNMLLVIFAAVVALNFYEPLGGAMDRGTGYGQGVGLIMLFALTYSLLRILVDWRFKNDIPFPAVIDKIGGAAGGFVMAMVGAGVVLVGLQLLPLASRPYVIDNPDAAARPKQWQVVEAAPVVDLDRYPVSRGEMAAGKQTPADGLEGGQNNFLLQPDRFALSLFSLISNTGLRGDTRFVSAHPDLLQEAYAFRATPHYHIRDEDARDLSRHVVSGEHVQVKAFEFSTPKEVFFLTGELKKAKALLPAGKRYLLVQVHLTENVRDETNDLRFCGLQFLLRTVVGEGDGAWRRNRFPVGWSEPDDSGHMTRVRMHNPRDIYAAPMSAARDVLLLFVLDDPGSQSQRERPAGLQFKNCGLRPFPPASVRVAAPGAGGAAGESDAREIRNAFLTNNSATGLRGTDGKPLKPRFNARFVVVQAEFHLHQFPSDRMTVDSRLMGGKPVMLKTDAEAYAAHGWSADGRTFTYHVAPNAKAITRMIIPRHGLSTDNLHRRIFFLFEVDSGVRARALQYGNTAEQKLE